MSIVSACVEDVRTRAPMVAGVSYEPNEIGVRGVRGDAPNGDALPPKGCNIVIDEQITFRDT